MASLTEQDFNGYAELIKMPNKQGCETQHLSELTVSNQDGYLLLVFDVETTGLDRNSEPLQISCISHDGSKHFSTYLLPEKRTIADRQRKFMVSVCSTETAQKYW